VSLLFLYFALAEAIFAVTEMNPDLTVAKIEIQTKAQLCT